MLNYDYRKSIKCFPTTKHLRSPKMAQKRHFAILRIKVTCESRGISAIAELLVLLAK